MIRLAILALLLFSGSALFGQGFLRDVQFSESYERNDYNFSGLDAGQDESKLILRLVDFETAAHTYYFQYYDAQRNEILGENQTVGGSSPARIIPYGPLKYVVRNGSGGGSSSRPYWSFWDFQGNLNGDLYPNYRGATRVYQRRDSLFLLYGKPIWKINDSISNDFQAHDTNTVYWLSYLNPSSLELDILDSVRIPFFIQDAALNYISATRQWELFHEGKSIRFKEGQFKPDSIFEDPRFKLQAFEHFGSILLEEMRDRYFLSGLSKVYRDESIGTLIRIHYGPYDTIALDLSPVLPYLPPGLNSISQIGNITDYSGDLPVLRKSRPILTPFDFVYHTKDSTYFFRIVRGKLEGFQCLPRVAPFQNYFFSAAKSTSEGGFYVGGQKWRDYENGFRQPLGNVLLYIDPEGRIKVLQEDETFNLHYNAAANSIKLFYDDPGAQLRYRILDASGRRMQEGDSRVYEGISVGNWRTGIYRIQLWTQTGDYIGAKPFLKN